MATPPLNSLSAVEIHDAIETGAATCEQVARAALDRIASRERVVGAWAYLDPALVLAEARRLDGLSTRGPLHGVPVGIKDVIDVHGMPTGMGSPIYDGFRPVADASSVAMLRAAGALILGKTVTCEFAGATPAGTTNPHDVARTPGGSSSGSAAAVADYMVPLALGTQTGGSVQRPSSYCGIVGYKPSYGLISRTGLKLAAESFDTIGFMARTVEDVELAARVLTHAEPPAWLRATAKLRIGFCRTHAWEKAEAATRQAVTDAATRLLDEGHIVTERDMGEPFRVLSTTREIVNDYERARSMAPEWQTRRAAISTGLSKSIERGLATPVDEYVRALRQIATCRDLLAPFFGNLDILLVPTAAGEAPIGLGHTGDHSFQSIWTQLRTPTVSLPTHVGPNGMPVGIQLVGRPYGDRSLLAAALLIFAVLGRGPVLEATLLSDEAVASRV